MRTSLSGKKKIVITLGEPSGIGPEVTVKALASPKVKGLADFFVVGDKTALVSAERAAGTSLKCRFIDAGNAAPDRFVYGRSDAVSGRAAIRYIDKAVAMIGAGYADTLVTAPVNKASVRMAGYKNFEGHKEYLAEVTRSKEVAMMFIGSRMKITLVTRHIPLKDVSARISTDSIFRSILITNRYLKEYFGIARPRIAVAGLNPHAGEAGAFGKEEKRIILPAVRKAAARSIRVDGPYPPDIIFNGLLEGKSDAVVAMYHDQALIPFKLLYFRDGVNLTVGLPFVRTSPDHGTAFDIAGKGVSDPGSMIEAIKLACNISGRKI